MISYTEFLAEAAPKLDKTVWMQVFASMSPSDMESQNKFIAAAASIIGPKIYDSGPYKKAIKAHKDYLADALKGGAGSKTAIKATPKAPVTPAPKADTEPKVDSNLYKFDIKNIIKKYEKVIDLLHEISDEGPALKSQFSKIRKGRKMNNIETPELMNLYTAVESATYVTSLIRDATDYMNVAKRIITRADALKKKEAK